MKKIFTYIYLSITFPSLAQIPSTNLEVYYPFNGNANDMSGNSNNGILMGGIGLSNDRFGKPESAYYFDGVDDYIIINGSEATFVEYSIAVWFKTSTLNWGLPYTAGIIFSGNHATSNRLGMPNLHLEEDNTVRVTGGYPGFGSYPEVVSNTGMANGNWHFLVANINHNLKRFEFYVDGVYLGSNTSHTQPLFLENQNSLNNNLTIGFRNGNTQYFEGWIDDFRIFSRQLSACEVNALYQEGLNIINYDTHTSYTSYTWTNGITYTANNNTALDTISSSKGCDSVITLNLTLQLPPDSTDKKTDLIVKTNTIEDLSIFDINDSISLIVINSFNNVAQLNQNVVNTKTEYNSKSFKDLTSNLSKLTKQNGFKLYPNPNNGNFTVEIENIQENSSIEVFDLLGNLIKTVETVPDTSTYLLDLRVAEGIYIVRLRNSGKTYSQKITVSH